MWNRAASLILPLSVGVLSFSCSSSEEARKTDGTQALFVAPASLDELSEKNFYDHPWPSDLRRDPDGSVHFAGLYNPFQTVLIQNYLKSAKGLIKGFSPVASAYL